MHPLIKTFLTVAVLMFVFELGVLSAHQPLPSCDLVTTDNWQNITYFKDNTMIVDGIKCSRGE